MGPIGPLKFLVQLHLEPDSQQRFQAGLLEAQKLTGHLCIEEVVYLDPKVPVQGTDIIIGSMEHLADPGIGENGG